MLIAGLRSVHGGGLAVLRDDTLEFGVRLDESSGFTQAAAVLAEQGFDADRIDAWAVDGAVGADRPYHGYPHTAGQVAAAYCTSPFAARGEAALVLVWDLGDAPLLHRVDAGGHVEALGALLPPAGGRLAAELGDAATAGAAWSGDAGAHAGTASTTGPGEAGMSAGTAGAADEEIRKALHSVVRTHLDAVKPARRFLDDLRAEAARLGVDAEHVRAGARDLLTQLVAEHLAQSGAGARAETGAEASAEGGAIGLCFTGDLATDPEWATALRRHAPGAGFWVPPFAGESGSAVGAALLHRFRDGGLRAVRWSRRCGPAPRRHTHVPDGWATMPCRPEELARILHRTGRAAAIVTGRADLGPETLGSRAVLAPAGGDDTDRWGPAVALCLLRHADLLFDQGGADPYAQFRHPVRAEWATRLPGLCDTGGTTRVRTVHESDDPVLATILHEYSVWNDAPLLAGVSADFTDAVSAMRSGKVDLVWSDGVLYRRAYAGRRGGVEESR
jgi:carbamoyltransferase